MERKPKSWKIRSKISNQFFWPFLKCTYHRSNICGKIGYLLPLFEKKSKIHSNLWCPDHFFYVPPIFKSLRVFAQSAIFFGPMTSKLTSFIESSMRRFQKVQKLLYRPKINNFRGPVCILDFFLQLKYFQPPFDPLFKNWLKSALVELFENFKSLKLSTQTTY